MPVQNSGNRNFRISLKQGDRELRISAPDQAWVDSKLNELGGWLESGESVQPTRAGKLKGGSSTAGKSPSLAEHVRAVEPSGGLEHVLAVGYYLERYSRLQGGFRRRDLAEAFKAVRYQHSNPGVPIATARRQGLLMDGEEHEKLLLTDTAERWVEERLGR